MLLLLQLLLRLLLLLHVDHSNYLSYHCQCWDYCCW
jgi:hypothetical protein